MTILGIRVSSQEIRYAIINKDSDGDMHFLNKDSEHRLCYPTSTVKIEDKLYWVKQEFERILRQHPTIDKIVVKMNEYAGSETGSKRETNYIDAIILLLSAEKGISVCRKLYSQIGTTSKETRCHAEQRVGKTAKYWNTAISDAINCAYWEMR